MSDNRYLDHRGLVSTVSPKAALRLTISMAEQSLAGQQDKSGLVDDLSMVRRFIADHELSFDDEFERRGIAVLWNAAHLTAEGAAPSTVFDALCRVVDQAKKVAVPLERYEETPVLADRIDREQAALARASDFLGLNRDKLGAVNVLPFPAPSQIQTALTVPAIEDQESGFEAAETMSGLPEPVELGEGDAVDQPEVRRARHRGRMT